MANIINSEIQPFINLGYQILRKDPGSDLQHKKFVLAKDLKGWSEKLCFWAPRILLIFTFFTGVGLLALFSEKIRTELIQRKWITILPNVKDVDGRTQQLAQQQLNNKPAVLDVPAAQNNQNDLNGAAAPLPVDVVFHPAQGVEPPQPLFRAPQNNQNDLNGAAAPMPVAPTPKPQVPIAAAAQRAQQPQPMPAPQNQNGIAPMPVAPTQKQQVPLAAPAQRAQHPQPIVPEPQNQNGVAPMPVAPTQKQQVPLAAPAQRAQHPQPLVPEPQNQNGVAPMPVAPTPKQQVPLAAPAQAQHPQPLVPEPQNQNGVAPMPVAPIPKPQVPIAAAAQRAQQPQPLPAPQNQNGLNAAVPRVAGPPGGPAFLKGPSGKLGAIDHLFDVKVKILDFNNEADCVAEAEKYVNASFADWEKQDKKIAKELRDKLLIFVKDILKDRRFKNDRFNYMKEWEKKNKDEEPDLVKNEAFRIFYWKLVPISTFPNPRMKDLKISPNVERNVYDLDAFLEEAKVYFSSKFDSSRTIDENLERQTKVVEYIKSVLEDRGFNDDPIMYMKHWAEIRGGSEEYRVPEDPSRNWIDNNIQKECYTFEKSLKDNEIEEVKNFFDPARLSSFSKSKS